MKRALLVTQVFLAALMGAWLFWYLTAAAQPTTKKRPKGKNTQDLIDQAESLLADEGGGFAPTPTAAGALPDAALPDAAPTDAMIDALPDAMPDALIDAAPATAVVDATGAPPPDVASATPQAAPPKSRLPKRQSRKERFASGANVELKGPAESPLADLGVPPAAVPVVAAAATATAMGFWPFLMKTLIALIQSLFKGMVADYFKKKAKEGQKVNTARKVVDFFGLNVRPAELGHIALGALVYGAAVYYTAFGLTLKTSALARQEVLVSMFYLVRAGVRYGYERKYQIASEYRFWFSGGLLCVGSAVLGNPLSTVGFELNTAKTAEEKTRMINMSVLMIFIALGLATVFFMLNQVYPTVFFQTATLACTGVALSDILPVEPMTGKKVWDSNKWLWAGLVAIVVPAFMLFNFVL